MTFAACERDVDARTRVVVCMGLFDDFDRRSRQMDADFNRHVSGMQRTALLGGVLSILGTLIVIAALVAAILYVRHNW